MLQEEIGEVFDRWKRPPAPPSRNSKRPPSQKKGNNHSHPPLVRSNSLPNRAKRNGELDKALTAWSEGLLKEFNCIIAQELTTLLAAGHDPEEMRYPEREHLLLRVTSISDSESSQYHNGQVQSDSTASSPDSLVSSNKFLLSLFHSISSGILLTETRQKLKKNHLK